MGKIVISRKQEWNNRLRQFSIYLDGQKLGSVGNGDVKTFEIPDGNHSIRAKVDWCGSRDIDFSIAGDEKRYFKLSGFRHSNTIMPAAIVLLFLSLILRRLFHIAFAEWLILPIFLLLLYYLTIGRNDYLTLVESESW